jgi:hypothetical protein
VTLALRPVRIVDSITRIAEEAAGAVVVNGSHGGHYAAYCAAKLHVAAAIFNDAGVGRDEAGISGLVYLADLAIPAAAVGHMTARIGDGDDMMARGVITHANAPARTLGCAPGMGCRDAAAVLQHAAPSPREPLPEDEAAFLLIAGPPAVWALDSASLVAAEHKGAIVITGSHGGLLGGRSETALKYDALAALFNDAGIGIDEAGVGRLPALDRRGIAAAAVSATAARPTRTASSRGSTLAPPRSAFAKGRARRISSPLCAAPRARRDEVSSPSGPNRAENSFFLSPQNWGERVG